MPGCRACSGMMGVDLYGDTLDYVTHRLLLLRPEDGEERGRQPVLPRGTVDAGWRDGLKDSLHPSKSAGT